jgi:hypothetical protein
LITFRCKMSRTLCPVGNRGVKLIADMQTIESASD